MKRYILVALATLGLGAVSLEAKKGDSHVITSSTLKEYEQASQDIKVGIDSADNKKDSYSKEQKSIINELKKKHQQLNTMIQRLKYAVAHKYAENQIENMTTQTERLLLDIIFTACIYGL